MALLIVGIVVVLIAAYALGSLLDGDPRHDNHTG